MKNGIGEGVGSEMGVGVGEQEWGEEPLYS